MTRSEAKLTGAKKYHGPPCKHCEQTERYAVNSSCVSCERVRQRSPEQRARTRAWYALNKERHKEMRDRYREDNRAEVRSYNDYWRRTNLKRMCAHTMAYNARKKQALPIWADLEEIKKIYAACPHGHQVDHVIPLRGRLVSGLHVAGNLQYLPGVENNEKGNRYAAA